MYVFDRGFVIEVSVLHSYQPIDNYSRSQNLHHQTKLQWHPPHFKDLFRQTIILDTFKDVIWIANKFPKLYELNINKKAVVI